MNMLMTAVRVLMDFTTEGAQEWLKGNSNLMEYESITGDFFRTVGFAILKALHTLANSVEEGLTKAYDILSFGLDDAVLGQLSQIENAVLTPLLTISVVIVGILFIVGSDKVKASKVLQNLAVSLGVLILMPALISTLNTATMQYVDAMAGSNENTIDGMLDQAGNNPMDLVDLAYAFSDGAGEGDAETRITTTKIEHDPWKIDPTEKISKKKDNGGYNLKADWEIFKWHDDGNGYFKECDYDGILKTGIGTERPYRYHYSFWLGFFNLLTYIIVIIFTIVRCAQLAYSLVFKRLLATILAATDIASGDKLKFVLKNILYTYLTLMYAVTALIIFQLAQSWITSNSNFNAALKVLMLLGIAYAVIDGPNIFKQVFGIDAGVKDGYGALDRTLLAARTARGVAKDVGRVATAPKRFAEDHKTHGNEARMSTGQVEKFNAAKAENKQAHQDLANAQAKYKAAQSPEEKSRYQGEMDEAADRIRASQKTMDGISNGYKNPFEEKSGQNGPTRVADQSAMPTIKQDADIPSESGAEASSVQGGSSAMPKPAVDTGRPAAGTPTTETAAAETPTAGTPNMEGPTAEMPATDKPITEQPTANAPAQSVEQSNIPSVQASEGLSAGQVQGTATVDTSTASQTVSVPATETQSPVSGTMEGVQANAPVQIPGQTSMVQTGTQVQAGIPRTANTSVQPGTQRPTVTKEQAGAHDETTSQTIVRKEEVVREIQKVQNAPAQQPAERPANPVKGRPNPKTKKSR